MKSPIYILRQAYGPIVYRNVARADTFNNKVYVFCGWAQVFCEKAQAFCEKAQAFCEKAAGFSSRLINFGDKSRNKNGL
jgi:hypothetical protein